MTLPIDPSLLPLDDAVGRDFYVDGGSWRLVYDYPARNFVLRRLVAEIPFDRALVHVAAGELVWLPPRHFDLLVTGPTLETVRRHVALLDAFLQSPVCIGSEDPQLRPRMEARLRESRAWLARRTLPSNGGEAPQG